MGRSQLRVRQNSAPASPDDSGHREFLDDVVAGLSRPQKALAPKYFYDQAGAALFDQITRTDDYYVTRVETAIMRAYAKSIGRAVRGCRSIVELGSGSGSRMEILLAVTPSATTYTPVDLSQELLDDTALSVRWVRPEMAVYPLLADFTRTLVLPVEASAPALGFMPGSTLGNFGFDQARDLLRRIRAALGANARFLVGVDFLKSPHRLVRAYDDRDGVTARFNRNLLTRINRELGADFDPRMFQHQAIFNPIKSRIEMHLVSTINQSVVLADRSFEFRAGETIHTESSYKFSLDGFSSLARDAGWKVSRRWTDPEKQFGVYLLTAIASEQEPNGCRAAADA